MLLVRRGNEPLKGQWSLPGGAVELGETLETAIAREVREETGLLIDIGPMIDVFDRISFDPQGRPNYHYVLVDFLCRPLEGTVASASSDAADVAWAPLLDLPSYGVNEATVSVIQKGFDRLRDGPWTPREVRWYTGE